MNENEKKKIFLMRVLVGVVVFIIFILWTFNLKNVWRDGKVSNNTPDAAWSDIRVKLEETLSEARDKMDKLEVAKKMAEKRSEDEFIAGLLKEAEKQASSSAVVATSSLAIPPVSAVDPNKSASTSPSGDCPKYINCMPTIDEVRSCVVPVGCEKITQIVY